MRRRRQKNNLLPKMIGLAVLINAILLPILAQFGVFKNIGHGQRLTPIELVKAPPPEKRPAPPKKAKKQVAKAKPAGHKAAPRTAQARRATSGPPPVRVVAAGGPPGSGGGGDAGITTSDSGAPAPPAPNPGATAPDGGAGQTPPPPPPVPVTPPTPVPAPPPVAPAPAPPPAPHVPVLTAAAPVAQPHPAIPDELRDADLNAAFEGLFTVRADGTATVKMVSSTGNPTLDGLALDAARHWTFRPATRDGQPVESYLRLRVEFDVSS